MSRGFVKETDQESMPIIPPRAALPDGVTNYVTAHGLEELRTEKEALIAEQQEALKLEAGHDKRYALGMLAGKIKLLEERLATARLLPKTSAAPTSVRIGTSVTYTQNGKSHTLHITGVDEADVAQNKVAFIAPIARALIGKEVGETATFYLGNEQREMTITSITS